ncbi:MAG: CHAD domain-containing protein [Anaerolineaceae bacterium]|nr:CHAD domain-containing protein [Anaerolineaceae bacterium]
MVSEKKLLLLQEHAAPVAGDDAIAEAGRKVLLQDCIKMLENEEGSRAGEDIECVHDMRVATRRMRSVLNMFSDYFKVGAIAAHVEGLRQTAKALGHVRDLDVMIADLQDYTVSHEDIAEPISGIINRLEKKRDQAREDLIQWLDSKNYKRFVNGYINFLTEPGKGVIGPKSRAEPHQVRHIAALMIHEALAAVRAYEVVLEDADYDTMHALRVAFKRLRYTVDSFTDVLGTGASTFVDQLKDVQDYLGRMNDIVVASEALNRLKKLNEVESAVRDAYIVMIQAEADERMTNFVGDVWEPFNTRTVQQKLSTAMLSLR